MISGFLTSVISSLRPRQHIEERLTLIIDFTITQRENKVDCAEPIEPVPRLEPAKHARYKRDCYQSGEVEKVTNEPGDNGAHRCVDYRFCKRTAIISAAKVRHCKRKGLPRCLVPLPREWRLPGHVSFWHLHVLPPTRGFALFN